MRKHFLGVISVIALVLAVFTVEMSSAQETLGLSIDPVQGFPGGTVAAQVDPADVAEHCPSTIEELQAAFSVILATLMDPAFAVMYYPGFDGDFPPPSNYEQQAYAFIGLISVGILFNQNGAAETALAQSYVLTFIDLATQEPVGEISSFDPITGQGVVTVPDVEPGVWPVIAACVLPDPALLPEAISAGAAYLEGLGVPLPQPEDPIEFATQNATQLLAPLVAPVALGLQPFTVLESDPQVLLQDLSDAIDALVDDGVLNSGQGNSLTRILRNAARSDDRDKMNPACRQLASFINNVEGKVAAGILSPEEGEELISEAETIQTLLGCP